MSGHDKLSFAELDAQLDAVAERPLREYCREIAGTIIDYANRNNLVVIGTEVSDDGCTYTVKYAPRQSP